MHVAYLLSFQFKPTKPIRPIIYSSYTFIRQILWFPLVSFRFHSFPSFSPCFPSFLFVSLRFSSFDFGRSFRWASQPVRHACKEGKGSRGGCSSRGHIPSRTRKVYHFFVGFLEEIAELICDPFLLHAQACGREF